MQNRIPTDPKYYSLAGCLCGCESDSSQIVESYILVLLCVAAFLAGFVDAIVGGGGLIQTPMGLILLPNLPVANVIGSLKVPSFSGTFFAAFQYFHIEHICFLAKNY